MTAIRMQVTTSWTPSRNRGDGPEAARSNRTRLKLGEARYVPTAGPDRVDVAVCHPQNGSHRVLPESLQAQPLRSSRSKMWRWMRTTWARLGCLGFTRLLMPRILFAVASMADRFLDAKAANVASVWAVQVDFVGLNSVDAISSRYLPDPDVLGGVLLLTTGARHFTPWLQVRRWRRLWPVAIRGRRLRTM